MVSDKILLWGKKLEYTIGGLKFALVLIGLFILALTFGTFMESYHGTEYANRLIYKSPFFMLLQFLLFLSIFLSTLHRLPPKKRLYGFYVLHLGLLLIFSGSFVTFYSGVDGTIVLAPNEPVRQLNLSEDIFTMEFHDQNKLVNYKLPFSAHPARIGESFQGITLKTFLPFTENELRWLPFSNPENKSYHSSQYMLKNDRVSQAITMSLHPEASASAFPASVTLGPLGVHYLPQELYPCFEKTAPSRLIIWDGRKKRCFTPEEKKIPVMKTEQGNTFLAFKDGDIIYTFFPDHSPWPVDMQFQMMEDSPIRIFNQKPFEEKPNLFLFGQAAAYFHEGTWEGKAIPSGGAITLPWMDFELSLTDHRNQQRPQWMPLYTKPVQENGQVTVGTGKALSVEVQGKTYWVKNDAPVSLQIGGEKVTLTLKKDSLKLPYEFNLDRFKMDMDPGTQTPASYESFVTLFTSEGFQKHHIFMNNPLKFDRFTFYQASYFQTEGGYGSVLSVNVDPGRPIKYLGSLMLVLGAIAHYQLNKKRYKRASQSVQAQAKAKDKALSRTSTDPILEV